MEAAFDFNRMKSTRTFLSVRHSYHMQRRQQLPWSKPQSSSYHGAFLAKKKLATFNRWSSHRSCSIKKVALKILQNPQENIFDTVSFLMKLHA